MSVRIEREIVYSTIPGFRPLTLDLYVAPEPRALCLWLHGGGWMRGSRANGPGPLGTGSRFLERAAERGLAVASVGYRLSGEARFPAQLDDVTAAGEYLIQHGDRHGVGGGDGDGDAVGELPLTLWGTSAGGHLAGLGRFSSPLGDRVRAVASWSAPVDLLGLPADVAAVGGTPGTDATSREGRLLGGAPSEMPELARAASPLHQVRSVPTPFLLVHGAEDDNIPPAQSERYAAALDAAGVDTRTILVEGADHFYGGIDDERLTEVVDITVDFLLASAG